MCITVTRRYQDIKVQGYQGLSQGKIYTYFNRRSNSKSKQLKRVYRQKSRTSHEHVIVGS
jgi:hypothetical protein